MKPTLNWQRTIRIATVLGLLSTSLTTVASAAQVRYRAVRRAPTRVVYERNHSNAGAVLGGFVGGLVLGAVLGSASQAHAQAEYVYQDPYTDQCYDSYDAYLEQCRYQRHPRVVRVIEVRTGRCVSTRRYEGGRWADCSYSNNDYRRYRDNHGRTWQRERRNDGRDWDRNDQDRRWDGRDRDRDDRYQGQGQDDQGWERGDD